jgi:hypothetical protein
MLRKAARIIETVSLNATNNYWSMQTVWICIYWLGMGVQLPNKAANCRRHLLIKVCGTVIMNVIGWWHVWRPLAGSNATRKLNQIWRTYSYIFTESAVIIKCSGVKKQRIYFISFSELGQLSCGRTSTINANVNQSTQAVIISNSCFKHVQCFQGLS